ncbi:6320_t:CDS:2 [Funneliformis geosporum]|nr:6320_t:CDS:2 [Funneliformis geosporum]
MPETSIPTELYSLVFRFLIDAGLLKTSETFKKEYKSIKDLKQEYDLVEVFKSYKSLVAGKNIDEEADSDTSSSSSSSGSSIEDSTDDDSSSSDIETFDEKVKNDYNKMEDSSSSSSENDSDSSEEEDAINDQDTTVSLGKKTKELNISDSNSLDASSEESGKEQNVKTKIKVKDESDSSDESSDESESSSSESEEEKNDKMEIDSDNDSDGESDNDSSSNEESETSNADNTRHNMKNGGQISSRSSKSENETNGGIKYKSSIKNNSKRKMMDETSSELDKLETANQNCSLHEINEKNIASATNGLKHNLDSCDETIQPSKKLNSSDLSTTPITYVTTSIHFQPISVQKNQRKINKTNQVEDKSNNNGLTNNRRINPDEVEFLDERLKDNSFMAKGGAVGSYGFKAHNDLIVTRGKDFRAQKTKKKRGSYRGGKIDLESHSIKFVE